MWYYGVDTTLIGGTKSGSEDSSFNTLLMCVSFFVIFGSRLLIDKNQSSCFTWNIVYSSTEIVDSNKSFLFSIHFSK